MVSKNNNEKTAQILPLFYKKVVPLNKETHSELYIEDKDSYEYTKDTNSIYIAAIEFSHVSREFPIVFASGPNEKVFPVALLGLQKNSNLFVDKKGSWMADYIPAYVRRYPFILAAQNDNNDNLAVCIDEGFPGFNTAKEGKPLFDKKGRQLDILSKAVNFLEDYHKHVQLTTMFCDNLSNLGLLEPLHANIELNSGKKLSLSGFFGINRDRLSKVKPTKLAELVKNNQMELIYYHLSSLTNMGDLLNRMD